MPIEIDLVSWLATPHIAAIAAFVLVAALSVVFYAARGFLSSKAQQAYVARVPLIAEILVSVGLIGLLSFAGRSKLEIDAVELKLAAHQAEREVAASFFPYASSECLSPTQPSSASASAKAISQVCKIWRVFNNAHDIQLPWLEASRQLELIAAQDGLNEPLRVNIKKMVVAIDRMQDVRHNAALVPLKRDILTSQTSWPFLLLCALSACVGVALKCARAALQLWAPR